MNPTFNLTSINYLENSKYQTLKSSLSSNNSRQYFKGSLKKHKQQSTLQSSNNANSIIPSSFITQNTIFSSLFRTKPVETTISDSSNKQINKRNLSQNNTFRNSSVNTSKDFNKTTSYFLVKNKDKLSNVKKKFVRFLLDEQVHYANLPVIENEFNSSEVDCQKIINKNSDIIKKKQKELSLLNSQMQKNLLVNLTFHHKTLSDYENQFNEINNKITSLKYDLGIYEEEKNRLMNEKTILDKRVKEAAKELSQNQNAYEIYKTISETVKGETKGRNSLINEMKQYQFHSNIIMENKLRIKKEKYAHAEFELQEIKQNVEELDKKLKRIHKKQKKTQKLVINEVSRNEKIIYDLGNLRRDYYNSKTKLFLIYQQFKTNRIDRIVSKYQNDNIKYNTSNSIYNFGLKNLTELQNQLTIEEKLHDLVNKQLNHEMKPKVKKNKTKHFNESLLLANETYGNIFKEISKLKYNNEFLKRKFYENTIKLKLIIKFIERYDEKFNNIIPLINYDIIHDSSTQFLSYNFSMNKINTFMQKTGINNKNINIKYNILNQKDNFELLDFQLILQIFLKFQRKVLFLEHSLILGLFKENYSPLSYKKDFRIPIVDLFSNEKLFEDSKQNRLKTYEQKFAIKYITNSNLFSKKLFQGTNTINNNIKNKNINIDNIQNKLPITTLISQYSEKSNDPYLTTIFKTKVTNCVLPYTNHLIYNDILYQGKKNMQKQKNQTTINAGYKSALTEPSSKRKRKTKLDEYNYIYKGSDESDENSDIIIEPYNRGEYDARNKNTTQKSDELQGWDTMNKYQKMNDLYKLKYNLFSKKTGNKAFDRIFKEFGIKKNSKTYREILDNLENKKRKIKIKIKVNNIQTDKELKIKYYSSRDIRKLFEDDKDYENERTSENKNSYNIINKHENKSKTATNLKSFMKMNTMEAFYPKSKHDFENLQKDSA